MITVVVLINGQPIFTRSARIVERYPLTGICDYRVDTGKIIIRYNGEPIIPLVKRMLDTIDEHDISVREGL